MTDLSKFMMYSALIHLKEYPVESRDIRDS